MGKLLDLLFTEESNGLVKINPEAKLLESVKKIIEADPGILIKGEKVKQIATKELSYVYFLANKDFFDGYEEDSRKQIVKERVGLPDKWVPSADVLKAIKDLTEDDINIQAKLLRAAKEILENYVPMFLNIKDYSLKVSKTLESTADKDLIKTLGDHKELIDAAKAQFKEMTGYLKDIKTNFELVDQLELTLKKSKSKEGKKTISRLETDHDLYKI